MNEKQQVKRVCVCAYLFIPTSIIIIVCLAYLSSEVIHNAISFRIPAKYASSRARHIEHHPVAFVRKLLAYDLYMLVRACARMYVSIYLM